MRKNNEIIRLRTFKNELAGFRSYRSRIYGSKSIPVKIEILFAKLEETIYGLVALHDKFKSIALA